MEVRGECLCGAVRWLAEAAPRTVLHCHCRMCRKHHGTAGSMTVRVPAASFSWLAGRESIRVWRSSPARERPYCAVCAAKVPWLRAGDAFLPAGPLTGDLGHLTQHEEVHLPGCSPDDVASPAAGSTGGCACGTVRFELEGPPVLFMHCHCSRCRRARGTAHASNAGWKIPALRIVRGASSIHVFDLPGAQRFGTTSCTECGGFVPRLSQPLGLVIVPIGTLDATPDFPVSAHIHVASRASWHAITDGLPQFAEGPAR